MAGVGLIAPPGDPAALAERIEWAIANRGAHLGKADESGRAERGENQGGNSALRDWLAAGENGRFRNSPATAPPQNRADGRASRVRTRQRRTPSLLRANKTSRQRYRSSVWFSIRSTICFLPATARYTMPFAATNAICAPSAPNHLAHRPLHQKAVSSIRG
jgi:hypothetical protein